jgi:small neutral amino acid transporter SnatA (MarC family)
MPPIPLIDIAAAFFIGMGPIKIVAAYLEVTHGASPELRRTVAIRTVLAATITALALVVLGVVIIRLLHLSSSGLVIGGSIVMLAVGLRTVLQPDPPEDHESRSPDTILRQAIHPLAVPTLLNPAGIAAAILLSAEIAASGGFIVSIGIVVGIAALDLVVLLALARYGDRVHLDAIVILERVFGMLLVAIAVQLLLVGLAHIGMIDPAVLP